mmetsp:Transcript_82462/g.200086  ORF Transcript_82462/g.200086 Transcript_82462/m.200086 type:complete len:334 (-) Transcript_82462:293-1294(-)
MWLTVREGVIEGCGVSCVMCDELQAVIVVARRACSGLAPARRAGATSGGREGASQVVVRPRLDEGDPEPPPHPAEVGAEVAVDAGHSPELAAPEAGEGGAPKRGREEGVDRDRVVRGGERRVVRTARDAHRISSRELDVVVWHGGQDRVRRHRLLREEVLAAEGRPAVGTLARAGVVRAVDELGHVRREDDDLLGARQLHEHVVHLIEVQAAGRPAEPDEVEGVVPLLREEARAHPLEPAQLLDVGHTVARAQQPTAPPPAREAAVGGVGLPVGLVLLKVVDERAEGGPWRLAALPRVGWPLVERQVLVLRQQELRHRAHDVRVAVLLAQHVQ